MTQIYKLMLSELQRKANIAEQVYDMAIGSGGNEALREKTCRCYVRE